MAPDNNIRRLKNGDESLVEAFLASHPETSMFLRSNLRVAGLAEEDAPYHGTYLASFTADGHINGVLARYWNKNIMMQAPDQDVLRSLTAAFRASNTDPIGGVLGDEAQAQTVISDLGLSGADFAINRAEKLYRLDLSELRVPQKENCRMVEARTADVALLTSWLRAYNIEGLGAEENAQLDEKVREGVDRTLKEPGRWVLEDDGRPVALSGFNATLPDIVQIGPVWTPPEHRSRGYARTLLAMTLQDAARQGVRKAVLFTDNPAAGKAYESIGFKHEGAFRLALLKNPATCSV
jgi:RimJ/RimL family protein N-acetyltransferase